ncbi:MAG: FAD-dependent oxidoreductase [Firmicutes bacterium]|nr:FAD-dependent oxidoreductase [Bacillota bacterium]
MSTELTRLPESYWLASTPTTDYPTLDDNIYVDVAVIGGGLAGISTAWMLKQAGVKVAVLEADRICQGTTGHSTAKITSQHSLIYDQIWTEFGEEMARQYAEANETAVQTMAEIIEQQEIDCDFQWQPAYVYTQQDKYVPKLEKEARAATKLGIKAEFVKQLDLSFDVKAALRFDNQAQFHPRKYVLALAEMIPGSGCAIFENTRAVDIQEDTPHTITTKNGYTVTADEVVVASHFPFHDGLGIYFARMYPNRSYVLGVRTEDKLPPGMYVTAENPGRSLRSQRYKDGEMILVAGEHHKTRQGEATMDHYRKLQEFAEASFTVQDIPYRWSTQDYTTIDNIPYIGQVRSSSAGVYVATGFRKWGISTSTVSALLIKDSIVNGSSPWQDVFSPQRKINLKSVGELARTNINVAGQLIGGKLNFPGGDIDVKRGEGKIVIIDGQRLGAYRDEQGKLHTVDITCPHMGCELKWNSGEKTWDCPCHGSRFTWEGDIVEGPAFHGLHHQSQGANEVELDLL